jgi:excisionase family DNA binding protein
MASVSMPKSGRMITIADWCERWGISRVHAWRMVKRGEVRAVKLGRHCVRVPESEIVRVAEGHTAGRGAAQ